MHARSLCSRTPDRLIGAIAVAAAAAGCGGRQIVGPNQAPVDLSRPWAIASPASQGVDSAQLAAAYARADTTSGLHSLLVVRNGYLIAERYFGGSTADSLDDGRSVTKSVMSLLVGIAIAHGVISGTTERLDMLLHSPVATIQGGDTAITVDNLLTMTSGFAWDESTAAAYNAWVSAPDQIDYLLARPLSDVPGTRFNYNSAAVHLLSAGLSEATGESAEAFADRYLFAPLGISDRTWETDNRGYNNGAAGLSLHARDLAKIGQLVLQDGASGADQVVPADWVRRMLDVHVRPGEFYGPATSLNYGYLWWLMTLNGHDVAFAWGYRGQFIVLVSDLHLVVVATSDLNDVSISAEAEEFGILNLIASSVIPAVRP